MGVQSLASLAINGVIADFGRETLLDAAGEPVALRPQTFAVLRHLATNPGRLVSKDELMAAVWPGLAVTDDSLVQCIHEIRRALRDERHVVLRTVPRRGYRFELPDQSGVAQPFVDGTRPSSERALPLMLVLAVALVVVAGAVWLYLSAQPAPPPEERPVLAVLPFDNIGGVADETYFADGITEDLITDLSRIPGLLVIARNSVWNYRSPVDLRKAASDLGARYILEGSVRRGDDALRINAQLIDSRTGTHLWAERYDGSLGDVFALQDQVIARIVSALAVTLGSEEVAASGGVETLNPQAYDALLLGLHHLHRDTEEETLKSIEQFKRAVALDPGYSRAYAALAAAYLRITLSIWTSTAGAGLDTAHQGLLSNLAKAMEKPTPLAYKAAAVWAQQTGRIDEAFTLIEKAVALAPNDPEVLVTKAVLLNTQGRAEEAEAELQRAMRLDPAYGPGTLRALSMTLFNLGRYEEAIGAVERIKALGADETNDYITLVASLGHLGRSSGVADAVERYNELALKAAWDPMSVQESQWYWIVNLFHYHRPYVVRLVEGLRKAGLPEGAGTDLALEDYKKLIRRVAIGEYDVEGATEVDVATAKELRDSGVPFVDVRAAPDYALGHVPGAVNLSLVFALDRESLGKVAAPDAPVVFYCHTKYCDYSAFASAKAVAWGYSRVYRFSGGFPEWKNAGYPVEGGQQ
jgi:TolB-like protein/rhodanese-related sulfurtransferase/Flp pilus assembly protein TadD